MRDYEPPIVDFTALPLAALERYAKHFGLSIDRRQPETLLQLVREHFAQSAVNETQALSAFEHANARARECTLDLPSAKRREKVHETPRKQQKKARTLTYGDMISSALKQLPSNQGTLDEICEVIEKQYSKQLNHELESGPRRIAVWRASVRKIINLNYGMRFHRISQEAEGNKAIFCLATNGRRGL
ncbi:hypothetical protein AB1Y20_023648 [Prymnesium parvum]|uniref:Histone deacetylase complex subunit SAP30 Sin3 binding domain-containing protein n=1 Tax=Prymnesium parvum TaxID=97485 RepID=A0AB34JGV2_PRYPA